MTVAGGGGIFISYRRQESKDFAGRMYDRLADRFGESQVFIDVDTIEPGVDFAEEIFRAVAACKVLLAVIGPAWLTATDGRGQRRLDDPDDIVRLEIGAALARDVRVIPILVEGAVMPARQDLPDSLASLARRNALLIRHDSFRSDVARLMTVIERVLAAPITIAVSGAPGSRAAGNAADNVAQQDPAAAQDNAARSALLLTDAERIANSLTDEYEKAQALSSVASAVAVSDPRRAARLADEAERIANSLTDEQRKARALTSVASAVAVSDPRRAARLADEAERIANSLPDFSQSLRLDQRGAVLRDVAAVVAVSDPGGAERIASSIADGPAKVRAFSEVAMAVAVADPGRAARLTDEAERIANSLPHAPTALVLSQVAGAVAVSDPDRAERIANLANSVASEFLMVRALSEVAMAVAVADPGRAARLTDEAEHIANSLRDPIMKGLALNEVAGAVAVSNPGRAERIANSIGYEPAKVQALSAVAKALAA
jgi:TIR domain